VEAAEMVATALTAGAAAGLKETATTAVKDSYAALVSSVRQLLKDRSGTAPVVDDPAEECDSHLDRLVTALSDAQVDTDAEVVRLARELLTQVDPAGTHVGKYMVQVHDSKGMQIGDGNTMSLHF
jgi:hypothetical protein